jgi:phosphopantetheinyl transferase (holo-ACP synthase)
MLYWGLGLLGAALDPCDVEVLPGRGGPPSLRLSARAAARLAELGAGRALVSLTHGVEQAAAWVLLVGAR